MAHALADRTWTDLHAAPAVLLLVPVGATEQHGPHLPLSTDTDIAQAIADGLAARRPDAIVAPAIAFGSSGEHQGFPGTLSIGRAATELLVLELGRSATETFPRVALISTHGGNLMALRAATARLRDEGRDVLLWTPRWDADLHAGRVETSLMLAIAPQRVRLARAERGATGTLRELLPALRSHGVRAVAPNGVLGDPGGATAGEGRALLARAIDQLTAALGPPRAAR